MSGWKEWCHDVGIQLRSRCHDPGIQRRALNLYFWRRLSSAARLDHDQQTQQDASNSHLTAQFSGRPRRSRSEHFIVHGESSYAKVDTLLLVNTALELDR